MFTTIFEDGSLQDFILQKTQDPWIGTPFERYVFMASKTMGEFGESFVSKYFEIMGSKVERAETSTDGYDRVIDGILTEIKFSLANRAYKKGIAYAKKDQFMINHLAKGKNWDRVVIFAINPVFEESHLVWFNKEDFINNVDKGDCGIQKQQGGDPADNDDYFCTNNNITKLVQCDWVKSVKEW
jgi:hypothetical protein